MNYRHAFHAGNHADILKHAALAAALAILIKKHKPLVILDAFAGAGRYDLGLDERAARTEEWRGGIERLWAQKEHAPNALTPYLNILEAENPQGVLRYYPGSPVLAQHFLRGDDRLRLVEKHPEEADMLAREIGPDGRVKIFTEDGWTALRAQLPPTPRRGVALIDPPFEAPGEYQRMAAALKEGLRRWATGVFLLWSPIVDRTQSQAYREQAAVVAGETPCLAIELSPRPEGCGGLIGSTMLCLNPPYGFAEACASFGPYLASILSEPGASGWSAEWLVEPR